MKVYQLDFKKLMVLLLPTRNRKLKYIAFLCLIASQIHKIYYEFFEFRNNLDASRKTQSCYMRALLNNYFDHYERRIIVSTLLPNYDDYLVHASSTGKFRMVSSEEPMLIQKLGNLLANHISFKVVLPNGFTLTKPEEILMQQLIESNKLPSKTYRIVNE